MDRPPPRCVDQTGFKALGLRLSNRQSARARDSGHKRLNSGRDTRRSNLEVTSISYPARPFDPSSRQPPAPSPDQTLAALTAQTNALTARLSDARVDAFRLRTELLRTLNTASDLFNLNSIN